MISVLALTTLSDPELAGLAGAEGPDLTQYLMVCGVLILLIGVLGFGFRKLARGGLRVRGAARALTTVDVLPLGSRQRVAVVRCYERSYLIGVGEKEVRLLAELDVEETESDQAAEDTALNAVGHTAGGFLETLRSMAGPALEEAGPRPARKQKQARKPIRLPGGGLLG